MTRQATHQRTIRLSSWATGSPCALAEQGNVAMLGYFGLRNADKVECDRGGDNAPEGTT